MRKRSPTLAWATLFAAAACSSPEAIIVSGASGQLGGLVVEALLARGVEPERLILVSRTPDALERYAAMGASTRFGDFREPESLVSAYEGGDRMLLISIDTGVGSDRASLHETAVAAAAAAGVRHIVYTSFVDLDHNDSPLAADHRLTEQAIRESGVAWTMLRNSLYMNGVVARAARMLSEGVATRSDVGGIAYVTREDCARAAAAVLAGEGHENRAYDITGPAVVFPQDIAWAASEITGTPIEIVDPAPPGPDGPPSPSPGTASFAVVSSAVHDLTGRPPESVADFLAAHRNELLAPAR